LSAQAVLAYLLALILVYVLFRLLYGPLRLILRVAYRTAIGAGILWVLNLAGNVVGFHIALNIPTAMTAGLLGVPGVIVLFVLHRLVG